MIKEPRILTLNTWKILPKGKTEQYMVEVDEYLTSIGFTVKRDGDRLVGEYGDTRVTFRYVEINTTIIKQFSVFDDGKRSNISRLRKIIKEKLANTK